MHLAEEISTYVRMCVRTRSHSFFIKIKKKYNLNKFNLLKRFLMFFVLFCFKKKFNFENWKLFTKKHVRYDYVHMIKSLSFFFSLFNFANWSYLNLLMVLFSAVFVSLSHIDNRISILNLIIYMIFSPLLHAQIMCAST